MKADVERGPSPDEKPPRTGRRGRVFGISGLASGLLTGLLTDGWSQSFSATGWVRIVGVAVAVILLLIWAIYNAPAALQAYRRRRYGVHAPIAAPELHAAAEEAEQWMIALGSDAGGMAAAEWYSMNEPQLREVLLTEKPRDETADDLARICDALEVWYLRRSEPGALLELSEFLSAVADGMWAPRPGGTRCRPRGDGVPADGRSGSSEHSAGRLGQRGHAHSDRGRSDDSQAGRAGAPPPGPS